MATSAHGVKPRWHDKFKQALKSFSISGLWYHKAQDRFLWKTLVSEGLKSLLNQSECQCNPIYCETLKDHVRVHRIKEDTSAYSLILSIASYN